MLCEMSHARHLPQTASYEDMSVKMEQSVDEQIEIRGQNAANEVRRSGFFTYIFTYLKFRVFFFHKSLIEQAVIFLIDHDPNL